jgi:hypothetical protein
MVFLIFLPIWASAEPVGNFTKIEEHVDYQKGGSGQAIPAKVKEPVEVKDVIQTYEVSRAQVLFRDQTAITIAPKSKVAVEGYMFDPAKFERSGSFELIQGVMKVVVPPIEKLGTTKFEIKSSTATMGVRGTEFVFIAGKKFSVVYSMQGKVCLKSNPKEPGTYKVGQAAPAEALEETVVCLDPSTLSVVLPNQIPSSAMPVSPEVIAAAEALVKVGINEIPGNCLLANLPGVDLVAVAKDLIARGADPDSVRESLAEVWCGAETFAYTPPGPPEVPVGLPTFPGGGGGGVASPAL